MVVVIILGNIKIIILIDKFRLIPLKPWEGSKTSAIELFYLVKFMGEGNFKFCSVSMVKD